MVSERHQDHAGEQEARASGAPTWLDRIICGDARDMSLVPDGAVSLIITSPPY